MAVAANQGLGDPILAVKDLDGMVAFHTAQPLVDRTVGIAFDRYRPLAGHTDQKAAARAAKSTGRLLPLHAAG